MHGKAAVLFLKTFFKQHEYAIVAFDKGALQRTEALLLP
jgi:hypothetical protein